MRITKNHRRIAKKKGWYEGHAKQDQTSWPYEDIELCLEYEKGYWEGFDAEEDAKNPYGTYSKDDL